MSSTERSHSAVRNLRSLFENKASADTAAESPDTRGRSPIGSSVPRDTASGRPLSRVRASFVAVEPPKIAMPSAGHDMSVADMGRASSIQARRGSFSIDNSNTLSISDLKQGVADERVRRESRPDLGTPMPENALLSAETSPVVESREDMAMGTVTHAASKLSEMTVAPGNENEPPAAPESEPPANPDKPNTGAEEEEGEMKPAEAVNEAAVSGGEALPPPTEDLTQQNVDSEAHGLDVGKTNGTSQPVETPAKSEAPAAAEPTPKPKPTHKASTPAQKRGSIAPQTSISKPSSISATRTKPSSQTNDPKSPTSPPTTTPATTAPKEPTRKPSRTSLAAPTAASKARTSSSEKPAPSTHASKPRESTKPADVSSRLLAPTAASRARHDPEGQTQAAPAKPATSTTRSSKPQVSSSKPAPRASTATRPESRSSHTSSARRPEGAGGSFLDRMMRPTAASAQKAHEKPEVKSPPRKTSAPTTKKHTTAPPKMNGAAKPAAKVAEKGKPLSKAALENAAEKTEGEKEKEGDVPAEAPEDAAKETEEIGEQKGGAETPVGEPARDEEGAAKLEGTPAFGEEGIR